jgi:23S rRNA (adenine2503-C2)-methyltransferase
MRVRLDEISSQTLPYSRVQRTLGSFATLEDRTTFGHVSKFAFRLDDDATIEGLLISTFPAWVYYLRKSGSALGQDRRVEKFSLVRRRINYDVCVSTQVGCAVDCPFCASSLLPFRRNLTLDEMLAQIETLRRALPPKARLQRIYYSGIGEPLLNYDVVAETARYLLARHYIPSTINTSGVIPAMEKIMSERLPVNLIVSIHAPNNELRRQLVPITKAYPLEDIIRVLRSAPRWMFIEAKYLLLENVNDSVEHANELADLLGNLKIVVTLQSYNQIAERDYVKSPAERIHAFATALRRRGFTVGFLNSNIGEPVEGGCGQMRMNDERAAPRRRAARVDHGPHRTGMPPLAVPN